VPTSADTNAIVNAGKVLAKGKTEPFDLLIVDDESAVREAIHDAINAAGRRIHHADSIDAAHRVIAQTAIDLVLIDLKLPDGDGLRFAEQLSQSHPLTRTMIVTGQTTADRAIAAIRAGCVDFISKPFDLIDLNERVGEALSRHRDQTKRERRLDRLRRLCRQLNAARHEITQQVDILCSDLVTAYQDLANQVQNIELTGELRTALDEELDLEQVLRRTLEFIIKRVGPTNAVIFLPGQCGAYTVGGYVNYSHDKAALSFILDQAAADFAPAIADDGDVVHLTSDQQIAEYVGDEMPGWMDNCNVLACPCVDENGEVLASLMLYRDRSEPFEEEAIEMMIATCPMVAGHLVKVIRVHHRHRDLFADDNDLFAA
jgi:DNA-binding response OmpR family regulator